MLLVLFMCLLCLASGFWLIVCLAMAFAAWDGSETGRGFRHLIPRLASVVLAVLSIVPFVGLVHLAILLFR